MSSGSESISGCQNSDDETLPWTKTMVGAASEPADAARSSTFAV